MADSPSVLVIGAGQSGLAMAQAFHSRGIPHQVLEANAQVGDNWRERWSGLRMFSPARFNSLPGYAFPKDRWHLPDKDEAGQYLQSYAEHFELSIRTGVQVERVVPDQHFHDPFPLERQKGLPLRNHFDLETSQGALQCRHLVVATGSFRTPFIPEVPGLGMDMPQLHSSNYRTPTDLPPGKVLVVGAGASGQQIATLLARDGNREVVLSGPNVPNLPRSFLGIDIYWWLYKTGIFETRRDNWRGRRMLAKQKEGGDISVGESRKRLKELGIRRLGRFMEWKDGEALFDTCLKTQPGAKEAPKHTHTESGIAAIVWATGYRNNYDWIEGEVEEKAGLPAHERGVSTKIPGLYFIGLPFQYRVNSATMGGVGRDAEFLAEWIAGKD